MFARDKRLSGPELKGLKARTAARSPFFTLKTAPNTKGKTRFAVIVGSAVDRRSVRRHTLKRRASAVLQNTDLGPRDVILIVSPSATGLRSPEFIGNLKELLKSI